jgi:hypothetical protein
MAFDIFFVAMDKHVIGYKLVFESHSIALTCHVEWTEIGKKKKQGASMQI